MKGLRYTIYGLLYAFLIFASGLMNIVIFKELDWTLILNAQFWIEILIDYSVYLSFFVITMMFTFDLLLKDPELTLLENNIFSLKEILIGDEFEKHIINKNYLEKKRTWIENIKTYIGNHDRNKSNKINIEIQTYPQDKWSKKTIRFVAKQEKLKSFISNDFVRNELYYRKRYNIDLLTKFRKIKFREITNNEVIYGITTVVDESSLLVRNPLKKQLGVKLFMILPSITLKVVYEILTIDSFRSTAELWKELSFLVIMCLFHALAGISASRKAHMDRKANATIRYGIANDYKNGVRYETAPMFEIVKEKEKEKINLNPDVILLANTENGTLDEQGFIKIKKED